MAFFFFLISNEKDVKKRKEMSLEYTEVYIRDKV